LDRKGWRLAGRAAHYRINRRKEKRSNEETDFKYTALYRFLLLASGCTDEQSGIPVASGTPLTITAEIGTSASPSSTDRLGDAAPANDYDLSKFRIGAQINVTCTRNSVLLASSGYTLNATGN